MKKLLMLLVIIITLASAVIGAVWCMNHGL
jgi:predicted S18 family serine protease